MDKKIHSIIKNKDDIIFLSDLRLNSRNNPAGLKELVKKLAFFGYTMYHKSMKSYRGVGILISKKIKHEVRGVISDPDDNFLLLDTIINDKRLTLGAVYGPNEDDMAFYDRLRQGILTV